MNVGQIKYACLDVFVAGQVRDRQTEWKAAGCVPIILGFGPEFRWKGDMGGSHIYF